ncbi:MAG: ABC transporter permease [Candidimonas sp.]|nr:MAG: ABC transporter permease [Candidimonas sp.]
MGTTGLAVPAAAPGRAAPRRRFDVALLLAPAVIFYGLVFVWPLLGTFHASVSPHGTLTASEYARFFDSAFYRSVLWRSVRISVIVTAMTALLGYPVAVYLSQGWRRGRGIVTVVMLAPMMVSAVVRSYGWIMILGPNGVLVQLLRGLGLRHVGSLLYSEAAVVIALTHVFLPFMILAVTGSLQQIDPALPRAARNLGASGLRAFLRITLPLSMPGVTAGSVIVFCLAASGFVTPALVGGATVPVMPYLVYQEGLLTLDWPFASTVAVILLVTTATVTALYSLWGNQRRYGRAS